MLSLHGSKNADCPRQQEALPRSARLGLSFIGLFSLIIGLSLGLLMVLAFGMSYSHGGEAIPNVRALLLVLLPIPFIGVGVLGLICTTMRRFVAMCVFLLLLIADLTVLATF